MSARRNVNLTVFEVHELAQLIIKDLAKTSALRNLRLVSKFFNEICIREIYRIVKLEMEWQGFELTVRFIKCLLARPDYLALIQKVLIFSNESHPVFNPTCEIDGERNVVVEHSKAFRAWSLLLMALVQKASQMRQFEYVHALLCIITSMFADAAQMKHQRNNAQ